jgi:hypothetical protein
MCESIRTDLELQEIQESDFDLSLTVFDPGEIDDLLSPEDDEKANAAPLLPETPMSRRPLAAWPISGVVWRRNQRGSGRTLLGEREPRLRGNRPRVRYRAGL